jgi:ribonuclease HII
VVEDWRSLELAGLTFAGVDEAGRGPWAGPVFAAAVVLNPRLAIDGLNDSKKLTAQKRDQLFDEIIAKALYVGASHVDHDVIDKINILRATFLAMRQAIAQVQNLAALDGVLVDGNQTIPGLERLRQTTIVGGDGKVHSIMAASIVAKVSRDRLMIKYDQEYPGYGFAEHKGYGTKSHHQAILRLGTCPIHRLSFVPQPRLFYE